MRGFGLVLMTDPLRKQRRGRSRVWLCECGVVEHCERGVLLRLMGRYPGFWLHARIDGWEE
jgi:hypothetical protein